MDAIQQQTTTIDYNIASREWHQWRLFHKHHTMN